MDSKITGFWTRSFGSSIVAVSCMVFFGFLAFLAEYIPDKLLGQEAAFENALTVSLLSGLLTLPFAFVYSFWNWPRHARRSS